MWQQLLKSHKFLKEVALIFSACARVQRKLVRLVIKTWEVPKARLTNLSRARVNDVTNERNGGCGRAFCTVEAASLISSLCFLFVNCFPRNLTNCFPTLWHGHCCLRSLAYPSGTIKPTLLLLSGFLSGHLFNRRISEKIRKQYEL